MIYTLTLAENNIVTGSVDDLKTRRPVWVDMTAPTAEELKAVARLTEISEEELKQWMDGRKRPITIDIGNYSLIILKVPIARSSGKIITEPCVMLISKLKNDFITIHNHPFLAINRIRSYSDQHKKQIFEEGTTEIFYTLTSEIVDSYHEVLDMIQKIITQAEAMVLKAAKNAQLMDKILNVKEAMIYFHRTLAENREIVSSLEKEYVSFLDAQKLPKFRGLVSGLTQLIEINSTYRDILTTITEIYLTTVSNNLNVIMKKITSWAAIILIPSLIAGIYGMNFKFFPTLNWTYGFWLSLGLMIVAVTLLYRFFRRNDWI